MKSVRLVTLGDVRDTCRHETSRHLSSLACEFRQALSYLKGKHGKPGFPCGVFQRGPRTGSGVPTRDTS